MTPYNDIFTLHQLGMNNSQIEKKLGTVTRKTIISALQLADKYNFSYDPKDGLSDTEIHRMLHPKKDMALRMPDMAKIMFELSLPGKSIAMVWKSYKEQNPCGYSKSKFQSLVREYHDAYSIGEYKQLVCLRYIKDVFQNANGKRVNCLFAQVYHSKKVFVITIDNTKARTWVHGLVKLIHQLGGAPASFVFLNKIPKALRDITENCLSYYGIAIEKEHIGKSSDMDLLVHDTLADLSKEFSIESTEKNPFGLISQAISRYNLMPLFAGSDFSAEMAFQLEAESFNSLPEADYDLVEFVDVCVQQNRHVEIDGNYYSVPFDYRHEKLTAYITDHYIDLCYLDTIICTHEKFNGKTGTGKYRTEKSHLVPDDLVPFGELSGTSLRAWARKIGKHTETVIDYLLRSKSYEIQGYKTCNTILHFSTKYGVQELEEACTAAIDAKTITYSFIAQYCKSLQNKSNNKPSLL